MRSFRLAREIKTAVIVFTVLVAAITPAQPINAFTDSDVDSSIFNSPFFDPTTCLTSSGPSDTADGASDTGAAVTGSDNEEKIWNYFTGPLGLNPKQAAGAMGNLQQENGFKTGPAGAVPFGLVQWTHTGNRLDKLISTNASDTKKRSVTSLAFQLDYIQKELNGDYISAYSQLKAASSIDEAETIWEEQYEGAKGQQTANRVRFAHDVYKKYSHQTDDSTPDPAATPQAASSTLDIKDIVDKYHLQSAQIQEVGGDVVADYKADEAPATPASTMKLVIVDTLLRTNIDLSTSVSVTPNLYYDGTNDLHKSSISLKEAAQQTLEVSSNTGANVIMKALGGVTGFTDKAKGFGYTHTDVKGYYDPSNDGRNSSTISDMVTAMNHIFTQSGDEYKIAQDSLIAASKTSEGNHYGVEDDANKWAGTSSVAGNVGKFKVNNKDYIIGLYYNGRDDSTEATTAMKQGSADFAAALKNYKGSDNTDTTASGGCCPDVSGASGGSDGSDSGSQAGIWNSGINAPYIVEQYAIEVLKDLAHKKGKSESDAVTQEHVLALVAWSRIEGGDVMNNSKFNLYNTGNSSPELVDGGHTADGLGSYKSFDAGVEATARTLAQKDKGPLTTALLDSNSKAEDVAHAESYLGTTPGTGIWAAAAKADPSGYEHGVWASMINQVQNNYKQAAGTIIGTDSHEQADNKTDVSKVQFGGGGGAGTNTDENDSGQSVCSSDSGSGGGVSANANGVVKEAIKLSWSDSSHGTDPNPAYRQAFNQYNPGGSSFADCGTFVSTVMRASGADNKYPPSGTGAQEAYVRAHPDKHDVKDDITDDSDLQPGDILIVNAGDGAGANGHTLIYIGKQSNGFDEASASLNDRAGNLGKVQLADSRGHYLRARLK